MGMELLDKTFGEIMSRTPEEPMMHWKALREQMPDWNTIHDLYGKGSRP